MSQPATPRGARPTAKAATEPVTGAWADPFLLMLDESTAEADRPRVVSVPDSNTAYALQQLCVSPDLPADGCLTARYVVSGANGLGTMLAGLVRDVGTLRDRERETLGALVDDNQGARWADFASRLTSSVGWPALVASTGPHGASGGYLSAEAVRHFWRAGGNVGGRAPRPVPQQSGRPRAGGGSDRAASGVLLVTDDPGRARRGLASGGGPTPQAPAVPRTPAVAGQDQVRKRTGRRSARRREGLGITGLALTTAKLLMHEGTGPICIGIEAPWGKGKSSFLRLVCGQAQRQTEANPTAYELLPVDFNAWVYSNAEQAWAGLAVEVVAAAEARLGRWGATRLRWSYAWEHPRRPLLGALCAALLAIGLSVLVAWLADWDVASESAGNPLADVLATFSPALVGVILLLGVSYRLTRPVSQRVQEYLARPDHESRRGSRTTWSATCGSRWRRCTGAMRTSGSSSWSTTSTAAPRTRWSRSSRR